MNRLYALFALFALAYMAGALSIDKRDISLLGKRNWDYDADSGPTRFILEKREEHRTGYPGRTEPYRGPGLD